MKKVLIFIVLGIAIVGFFYGLYVGHKQEQIYCTMEAKLCPDGSYVGRTGPKCEFAPCPGGDNTSTTSSIHGTVMLGPTCPVMREPPDPQCADRPFQTSDLVLKSTNGKILRNITSGIDGQFIIEIPKGEYIIESSGKMMLPRCSSTGTIVVSENKITDVTISCDSGIR